MLSSAWWKSLAAIVAAFVTAVWGQSLGIAVQSAIIGVGGLIVAVDVHGLHATARQHIAAAAQVAVAKQQTTLVASPGTPTPATGATGAPSITDRAAEYVKRA